MLNKGAWQDRLVADDSNVTVLQQFDNDRLSLYLGALGMPDGLTAYVGLQKLVNLKPGCGLRLGSFRRGRCNCLPDRSS